jgi:hypothetical protein
MTIHQAKGLEFTVTVVGSLDVQLSSPKIIDRDLQRFYHRPPFEPEQRITQFDRMRLYYVAFSRAAKTVALTTDDTPRDYFAPIWQGLWTGKRLRDISEELAQVGLRVCPNTVRRLLDEVEYALHANRKSLSANTSPLRDQQFECLNHQRHEFTLSGFPSISVDTKKKELVGQFKNNGRVWSREPILADGGGSNGARCRAWKLALQEKLVDPYQVGATVCHYPTGASKWNPVEHRLFSEISKHWSGQPLTDYETVVRGLLTDTQEPSRRPIGFHAKETAPPYRTRPGKTAGR